MGGASILDCAFLFMWNALFIVGDKGRCSLSEFEAGKAEEVVRSPNPNILPFLGGRGGGESSVEDLWLRS